MTITNVRRLSAVGVALVILYVVIGMMYPQFLSKAIGGGTPPPPAASKCATEIHFLAYHTTGHNFGPGVSPANVAAGKAAFKTAMCEDTELTAADITYAKDGLALSINSVQSQATGYAKDKSSWNKAVTAFFATAKNWKLMNVKQSGYNTLGQVPGANKTVQPSLISASLSKPIGLILQFTYNGVVRQVRLACGFQPEEAKPFKNVPTGTVTSPPHESICKSFCGNTPTPTPSSTCPCVSLASASQTVPAPASPTNDVTQTSGPGPDTSGPGTQPTQGVTTPAGPTDTTRATDSNTPNPTAPPSNPFH